MPQPSLRRFAPPVPLVGEYGYEANAGRRAAVHLVAVVFPVLSGAELGMPVEPAVFDGEVRGRHEDVDLAVLEEVAN